MYGADQPFSKHPHFVENAIQVLERNMSDIQYVSDWAGFLGLSRSYFSSRFSKYYGEPPAHKLRRIRFRKVYRAIYMHPRDTSYCIARRVGLKNEQALYKFLSLHYDTNFTELRKRILRIKARSNRMDTKRTRGR